jgi:hypothetical protein
MIGLSNSIVFLAIIFSVASQENVDPKSFVFITTEYDKVIAKLCQTQPGAQPGICQSTSTPPGTTTPATTSAGPNLGGSSSSLSPLESAHWCHLTNGTYLSLGYLFMYTPCTICQCTSTRDVRCAKLACMNTYCVDDSAPAVRDGQCCPQCAYEASANKCYANGVGFPHG